MTVLFRWLQINYRVVEESTSGEITCSVIPESAAGGYPWFDRLTTLSEVEGESRCNAVNNVEGCQGNVHTKEKRMNAHSIQPLIIPNYFVIEVFAPRILCLLHVFHKSGENIENYSLRENTHVFLLCTLLLQHTLSPLVAQE